MAVHSREQQYAISISAQTDIATLVAVGELISVKRLNLAPINPGLVVETDAGEMGAGHEFATQGYPSHNLVSNPVEKYVSSQWIALMAWACLGSAGKGGTPPALTYTCIPQVPGTDGIELPYLSQVQIIRAGDVFDEGFAGCVVNSFQVVLGKGPGRANAKVNAELLCSGIIEDPTGYTLPTVLSENFLSQGTTTLTALGNDYVTAKTLESLTWGWNNNIPPDSGFFVGSGADAIGAAVQGRFEFSNRQPILNFVVRVEEGSDELTNLRAQTKGTVVITQGSGDHMYTATFHQVAFSAVERTDGDGLVVVNVTCSPEYHASNGILTVVAKTSLDGIGGL